MHIITYPSQAWKLDNNMMTWQQLMVNPVSQKKLSTEDSPKCIVSMQRLRPIVMDRVHQKNKLWLLQPRCFNLVLYQDRSNMLILALIRHQSDFYVSQILRCLGQWFPSPPKKSSETIFSQWRPSNSWSYWISDILYSICSTTVILTPTSKYNNVNTAVHLTEQYVSRALCSRTCQSHLRQVFSMMYATEVTAECSLHT